MLAYSPDTPQPGMAYSRYKNDHDRFNAAWHVAHCTIEYCEYCTMLCDEGLIISCDSCGNTHHTDWLGWTGSVNEQQQCLVYCPECV